MNKVEFSRTAKVPFQKRYGNFIGGRWVEPRSDKYFENFSPVNGRLLCEIARSNEQDIELALDAAHSAKDAWGRTSVAERAVILNKIADRMKRISISLRWPRPGIMASRSARPPRPMCRSRSTISATSPVRFADRKAAFPRLTTTRSPIISTNRSASWVRSFRGTSRC